MFLTDYFKGDLDDARTKYSKQYESAEFQTFMALKSFANWMYTSLKLTMDSRKRNDDIELDDNERVALSMTCAEFREAIHLAYGTMQFALETQERHRSKELLALQSILKEALSDWNSYAQLLLLDFHDNQNEIYEMGDEEVVILIALLNASVKCTLDINYLDSSDSDLFFEEALMSPSAPPGGKESIDRNAKRTIFVRDMHGQIGDLLQRFGSAAALSTNMSKEVTICKVVSLVEIALWTMVGMPTASIGTFFSSAKIWLDLRKITEYEQLLGFLIDQMFMKHSDGLILRALGRLLFGSWRLTESFAFGLGEATSALRHAVEVPIRHAQESILSGIEVISMQCLTKNATFDSDDMATLLTTLLRLEVMVAHVLPACGSIGEMSTNLLRLAQLFATRFGMMALDVPQWMGETGVTEDINDFEELPLELGDPTDNHQIKSVEVRS